MKRKRNRRIDRPPGVVVVGFPDLGLPDLGGNPLPLWAYDWILDRSHRCRRGRWWWKDRGATGGLGAGGG